MLNLYCQPIGGIVFYFVEKIRLNSADSRNNRLAFSRLWRIFRRIWQYDEYSALSSVTVTMNFQTAKRRGRISRYAPLILWIGIVLFASTGNASMAQTSRFIRPLLEFLFPNTPAETLQIYHAYIRKSAHFIEYAILAFWTARAFADLYKTLSAKILVHPPFFCRCAASP